jgi:flagellar hook-associated protein 3 FlgL
MGNVSLLAKGEIATNATKMSEISNSTLLGKSFEMQLTDVNGVDKTVKLDLANPSSFSVNGTSYPIVDADGVTPTSADNFSLSQLNNVISMAMADSLPTGGRSYEEAVVESKKSVSVSLDSAGVLSIKDKTGDNNAIKFSMYDSDPASSSLSFMANRAVIVDNPKVDFFKDLDTIIEAVRNGNLQPDANSNDPLNPGISNAITKLSNLSAHLSTQYSKLGSMSSNLQNAHDRAQTVETSVKQLKSEVTDIDIAQTVIEYQQVSLNYQAMMSTISKVNSLTLLNYLR